ncbi:hypothetical protein Tco_0913971 [Tanacetum coccineum]
MASFRNTVEICAIGKMYLRRPPLWCGKISIGEMKLHMLTFSLLHFIFETDMVAIELHTSNLSEAARASIYNRICFAEPSSAFESSLSCRKTKAGPQDTCLAIKSEFVTARMFRVFGEEIVELSIVAISEPYKQKNGLPVCSKSYWVVDMIHFPVALAIFGYECVKLYKESKKQKSTENPESVCEAIIDWTAPPLIFCAFCGMLGGTIGGLLGFDGGFILGPLLLEIGTVTQLMPDMVLSHDNMFLKLKFSIMSGAPKKRTHSKKKFGYDPVIIKAGVGGHGAALHAAKKVIVYITPKNKIIDKSSHNSLVELENRMVKEDRTALLEGVVLQAASPASHSSSITSPVVRLFTMDESFLLENR